MFQGNGQRRPECGRQFTQIVSTVSSTSYDRQQRRPDDSKNSAGSTLRDQSRCQRRAWGHGSNPITKFKIFGVSLRLHGAPSERRYSEVQIHHTLITSVVFIQEMVKIGSKYSKSHPLYKGCQTD